MGKVSFVCTTYRRFRCVERIVAQYCVQTYPNKELIIFNTDTEHPYKLGFEDNTIKIINNNIDYITNLPYTNRGDICRDAITHATGDYFMLADDDDIYLPWHLQQAVEGIEKLCTDAWKPEQSFFAAPNKLILCRNTLEASVIVKINRIREIGFRNDLTGYEGLSWYTKLRDEKQLDEHNKNYIPSYCFNWSDPAELAGHKQSGDINNPNNFENHKLASTDYALRPIMKLSIDEINLLYQKYYNWIEKNLISINKDYYEKYAKMFTHQLDDINENLNSSNDKNLKIINAIYGNLDSQYKIGVTDILNSKIENNRLNITANNYNFTDPCNGVVKKLYVKYEYNNNIIETLLMENESLILP